MIKVNFIVASNTPRAAGAVWEVSTDSAFFAQFTTVFDLPGGVNSPLHEDYLSTGTCLGGRLGPPRRVPGETGQNVGYQKNFLLASLADYFAS